MNRKLRVGLIYGGKSGEHQVSLQTALAVINAIDHAAYEIHPFYITPEGEWRSQGALPGPVKRIDQLTFASLPEGKEPAPQGAGEPEGVGAVLGPLFASSERGLSSVTSEGAGALALDVAFPLLHGTFGEDGTIQGLFEMADIPYVGAGVLASAVGMDKIMMKKIFAQEGLTQCVFRYFTRSQWEKDEAFFLMEVEVAIGYPCFIKPANLGSSVGVSKASNREELTEAIRTAFKYDRKVIVEEFVDAREIEVAVLGNDEPQASVPGEIVSSSAFYDYKSKYIDGKSTMIIPAELPEETKKLVRDMAVRAFQAIDANGLSRVDFFLSRTDGKLYINEINTMPGFTPFSMYPLLWRETGKPYAELLDDLIKLAFQRHADKKTIQYKFDVE